MKYGIRITLVLIALLCLAAWELNLSMVGLLSLAGAAQAFMFLNKRRHVA